MSKIQAIERHSLLNASIISKLDLPARTLPPSYGVHQNHTHFFNGVHDFPNRQTHFTVTKHFPESKKISQTTRATLNSRHLQLLGLQLQFFPKFLELCNEQRGYFAERF